MKMYRIHNTKTGLFSNGGLSVSFSRNGKMWRSKDHLMRHLKYLVKYGNNMCISVPCLFNAQHLDAPYKGCLVVEYDVVVSRQRSIDIFLEEFQHECEKI